MLVFIQEMASTSAVFTLSCDLIMLYLLGGMAVWTLKNSVFVIIGRTLYVAPVFHVVVCVGLVVNGS